jgi:hypothetical protein
MGSQTSCKTRCGLAFNSENPSKVLLPHHQIYKLHCFPKGKDGTADAVRKDIPPNNNVDLSFIAVIVEATEVCIPIGNSVVLLVALYMFPGRPWSDSDIAYLLKFKSKSLLAGDPHARYPFWNSVVSDTSDDKVLYLFDINEFQISAVLCSIH